MSCNANQSSSTPSPVSSSASSSPYTSSHSLVKKGNARDMAVITMAMMRENEEKLIRQSKRLIKHHKAFANRVFTADIDGWTPIHACTLRGSKRLLKTLLAADIDINCKMGQPEGLPGNCSMLHMAAQRGDVKILEMLLSRGAHINVQDSFGRTPVFYASGKKNRRAVRMLEEHGADMSGIEVPLTPSDCITPQPSTAKFCFF